jgi:hypothetical protein
MCDPVCQAVLDAWITAKVEEEGRHDSCSGICSSNEQPFTLGVELGDCVAFARIQMSCLP